MSDLLENHIVGFPTRRLINNNYTVVILLQVMYLHYENMPMQYTKIFSSCKEGKFAVEIFFYIFLIFARNIDCGYMLEPPWQGGSNEYPQSMFWNKYKKNSYTLRTPVLL